MRDKFFGAAASVAMCVSGMAFAKTATQPLGVEGRYVLTDPISHAVLANTPYFLLDLKSKTTGARVNGLTNAAGQTAPISGRLYDLNDPLAPVILVRAEGNGSRAVVHKLKNFDLASPSRSKTALAEGAPYVLFSSNNNQTLCGFANKQGYTQAYLVDPNNGWNDNATAFLLKNRDTKTQCASARKALVQLFDNNDSDVFFQGLEDAKSLFVFDEHKWPAALLKKHIDRLIKDKTTSLTRANQKAIRRSIDTARAEEDDAELNSIGYSLGFYRQDYKAGLPLLDEALAVKPNDCYYLNSKGYLLMRKGDLAQSRDYLQNADLACKTAAKTSKDERDTDPYALAANNAHLAENYGLSGDVIKANQYFKLAIQGGSVRAREEIVEVGAHLSEAKILDELNKTILKAYIKYIEAIDAQSPQATEPAALKTAPKRKTAKH